MIVILAKELAGPTSVFFNIPYIQYSKVRNRYHRDQSLLKQELRRRGPVPQKLEVKRRGTGPPMYQGLVGRVQSPFVWRDSKCRHGGSTHI